MDEKELIKIKNLLIEHEERISSIEKFLKNEDKIPLKKLSLREFLNSKKPSDDVKKTLAICFYLETYGELDSFNKEDIEEGYRKAKEKVPSNINYKVSRNIVNGYLMEAKEKKNNLKAWTLTNTGIEFVENSFKIKKKL